MEEPRSNSVMVQTRTKASAEPEDNSDTPHSVVLQSDEETGNMEAARVRLTEAPRRKAKTLTRSNQSDTERDAGEMFQAESSDESRESPPPPRKSRLNTGRVVLAIDDIGDKIERAIQMRGSDIVWRDLPFMKEVKHDYPYIDEFLHQIESQLQVQRSRLDVGQVVLKQMSPTVRDYYLEHYLREYGEEEVQYPKLVQLMGYLANIKEPEEYLEDILDKLKPGMLSPEALRVSLSNATSTYRRMCKRVNQEPVQATPARMLRRYMKLLRADIRKQLIPVVGQPGYDDITRVEKLATQIYNAQEEIDEERRERKRGLTGEERGMMQRRRFGREDIGVPGRYTTAGAVLRPRNVLGEPPRYPGRNRNEAYGAARPNMGWHEGYSPTICTIGDKYTF